MKIPNPYFKDIPEIGNLKMEKIIVDYDYPLLSVLLDEQKSRYLCLCFDTRGCQQWLITYISTENLIKLLTNKLTLSSPFTTGGKKKIHAVLNYETKEEAFSLLSSNEIPTSYLPAAGEYLDAEDDEWIDYIECIRNSFQTISSINMKIFSDQIFRKIDVQIRRTDPLLSITQQWRGSSNISYKREGKIPCLN